MKLKAILLAAATAVTVWAQPVAVRFTEGVVHGYLRLSSQDGVLLADGTNDQVAHGSRVTTRLTFHFKDGSLQDETTIFSQQGHFKLISDHLIQKGPMFKRQIDLTVDGATGNSTVKYSDKKGEEKVETAHLDLPPDVANGMVPVLLKNVAPGAALTAWMVVPSPKPMLVKLAISPDGQDPFSSGSLAWKATKYVVKVEIPGVKGVVAPIVGKQPADTYVWMLGGVAPSFVKTEGPSCEGCAIWRMELAAPVWPKAETSADRRK